MYLFLISLLFLYFPQNAEVYTDQQELESIIKQAAKERLRLEQQINTIPVSRHHFVVTTCNTIPVSEWIPYGNTISVSGNTI